MKILFTTPELGFPPSGGPTLRIFSTIKALNKICELHVVSGVARCNLGSENSEFYLKKYCKKFSYLPSIKYNFSKSFFYKFKRKVCKLLDLLRLKKIDLIAENARFILKYARKNSIDVIWVGFGCISYDLIDYLKKLNPKIKIICDTDSVWSRFVLRGLPYAQTEEKRRQIEASGKRKEFEEKQFINVCEVTTAVSELDADYYRSLTNQKDRVQIFSNVIDFDDYQIKPDPPKGFKKPSIFLAGSFGKFSPMEQAACWVIEKIWPILKQSKPELHFYIVGRGSKEVLSDIRDENITIAGMVDSTLPYLCNCDVALVPLWFESGTRFKILEAAACGIPIVSTTLGAEGLNVENGRDILIADEPEKFAEGVLKILEDKQFAKNMANNCRKLVQENYSLENLKKEGQKILNLLSQ